MISSFLGIEYLIQKHNRRIEHKFSYCSHSPSPARAGAPSAGSLWHKSIMLLLFIRFLLIGKAFIEPRHYGGVFILQKCGADENHPHHLIHCINITVYIL